MKRQRVALGAVVAALSCMLFASAHANGLGEGNGDGQDAVSRTAITQVLDVWALRSDQGQFADAAALFTPNASLGLYYNNVSAVPAQLTPTGQGASPNGISGVAGAGCRVQGRGAISSFLAGRAPTYGPSTGTTWPSSFRTTLSNTVIQLENGGSSASARSYYTPNQPAASSPQSGQLWTHWQQRGANGWQIDDMKIVFTTAQPLYPCQN